MNTLCGRQKAVLLTDTFRIHEFNVPSLIVAFLPYHSMPVFVTLMSILPQRLPDGFRFLEPYARSLMPPPRSAIVRHAMHHLDLSIVLSENTLQACRSNLQFPALIAFWGGLMVETVNGTVDATKSGRRMIQIEREKALLQHLGPILGEALAMKGCPSVQVASYMIVAVFASKSDIGDGTLSAFMENVVVGWSADVHLPGLVCLSILAQCRANKKLPGRVAKTLLKTDNISELLVNVARERSVEHLAFGLILALLDRFTKKGDERALPVIRSTVLCNFLQPNQAVAAFRLLLSAVRDAVISASTSSKVRKHLAACLAAFTQESEHISDAVMAIIQKEGISIEDLELRLDASVLPRRLRLADGEDSEPGEVAGLVVPTEDVASAVQRLSNSVLPASYFLPGTEDTFRELYDLFRLVAPHRSGLEEFNSMLLLGKAATSSQIRYLTFYARVWSGPYPLLARIAALQMVSSFLASQETTGASCQMLLPYCILAMADEARRVRNAAAQLFVQMHTIVELHGIDQSSRDLRQIYGPSFEICSLSSEATKELLHELILPTLEESCVDSRHLALLFQRALSRATLASTSRDEIDPSLLLSQSAKPSILAFLSAHAQYTPLLAVKVRLLSILNEVQNWQGSTRTKLLLPILEWWAGLSSATATSLSAKEALDELVVDRQMVEIVLPVERAGVELLVKIIQDIAYRDRPTLLKACAERLRKVWNLIKEETRQHISKQLLRLALRKASPELERDVASEEAADLLQSVSLSTETLACFLHSVHESIVSAIEAPPSKRRRTIAAEADRGIGLSIAPSVGANLKQMAFVLQLIEGSTPANHPELFQDLFQTLFALQSLGTTTGSELGYLQGLTLTILLGIIPVYQHHKLVKLDSSTGYGDILVDCIRKSSTPAVQNAALLLVGPLAKTAPDIILHSVMPIFTFMGTTVLRQSDDYSAHVINQTIKEVIPPLIATFKKTKKNVVASASGLLSSFIVAYEHIPTHRKHDLFVMLLESLGPTDFLFAMVAMFADKYGPGDRTTSFLSDIVGAFPVGVQLDSLVALIDLVSDIFRPNPNLSHLLLREKDADEAYMLRVSSRVMAVVPALLSNQTLQSQMAEMTDRDDMESARLRDLYSKLLEDILTLSDAIKTKRQLRLLCGDTLTALLQLLSISDFIKAVDNLLGRPNLGLRQKVLRALEVRVDSEKVNSATSKVALLAFIPQLTAAIRDLDDIAYKYTAVICVDKIAEKYGKKDLETITAAAITIAGDRCLGHEDRRLNVIALLSLASLADVLQDRMVPILPTMVPKALLHLKHSLEGPKPDQELHNAFYTLVMTLFQNLPFMISDENLIQLLRYSSLSAELRLDEASHESRKQCLALAYRRLKPGKALSSLQQTWTSVVDAGLLVSLSFHP
jgi:U3 small nucleolar RNA-associated protein 10